MVTPSFASIGTVNAVSNGVVFLPHHQRNLELVEPLAGHRHADQAAAVRGHEVDDLRRHLLGRDRQVAFVLAILVVDDDDHLAAADGVDGVLDRRKRAARARALGDFELWLPCQIYALTQRRSCAGDFQSRGRRTSRSCRIRG